uniref:Uncharacterized protein n=1 Tax=Amphimedon queenslandica TaxID=400682 RepID=A0A1X7TPR8_AMPQE
MKTQAKKVNDSYFMIVMKEVLVPVVGLISDIECQSENDDINSPLTSGDEEGMCATLNLHRSNFINHQDCDEILTIVPDFPDTVYDSDDDIVIYSRKDSYKAVASQFAKQAHPPTRIGSLPTSQLFHDLKSQEVKFIKTSKDPKSSTFFMPSTFQEKFQSQPKSIWPLTNDVIAQQIFLYLEEIAALHCKETEIRKAVAVQLLWPEAMVMVLKSLKGSGMSHQEAELEYRNSMKKI